MVRKRSPDRTAKSSRIDDLKLINGIGPGVEKRLNGVGIFTFAQLAALSPADIAAALADLTGLSSERIIKQDWINQARKLGAEAAVREAQRNVQAPVEPLTPLAPKPRLTGTLRVCEMTMVGVESSGSRRTLTHDEPFDIQLTLDLTGLQVPGNTPLNYKASLYGKDVSSRSGLVIEEDRNGRSGVVLGKVQGTIIPADTVIIKVERNTLPEGSYHLAGTVIIGLPGMKLAVRHGTTAVIDGGQIQVL